MVNPQQNIRVNFSLQNGSPNLSTPITMIVDLL